MNKIALSLLVLLGLATAVMLPITLSSCHDDKDSGFGSSDTGGDDTDTDSDTDTSTPGTFVSASTDEPCEYLVAVSGIGEALLNDLIVAGTGPKPDEIHVQLGGEAQVSPTQINVPVEGGTWTAKEFSGSPVDETLILDGDWTITLVYAGDADCESVEAPPTLMINYTP